MIDTVLGFLFPNAAVETHVLAKIQDFDVRVRNNPYLVENET